MRSPARTTPALSPRTVGRGKAVELPRVRARRYLGHGASLVLGDALAHYPSWAHPTVIVSDGAYGLLGFEGDLPDHQQVADWYEPHVKAWAEAATGRTTLWFWNSEIGWAVTHPLLERHGFRYVACNVWNKGRAHIAGNVSTRTIRRFPVVTEICAHYVFEPKLGGLTLKEWLRSEWCRSNLPLSLANRASGVADAATRKYLTQGHLWYFPPGEAVEGLARYANQHGAPEGRPYFSLDGRRPLEARSWENLRSRFTCPHGVTNVWERPPIRDGERVKTPDGRAVHLNQKPLDLLERLITVSSDEEDVVWEPFGGLFTASLAASRQRRRAFAAELDPTYFEYVRRLFLALSRGEPSLSPTTT
jgi:hypothetical protein